MKLLKENIITEVEFKNGKGYHIGEYAFDGIITGFTKIDDYIVGVLLADGFEGWGIYLDVNGDEVEYND